MAVLSAGHDGIVVVGVDIVNLRLAIRAAVVAGKIRLTLRADLRLALSGFAHRARTVHVRQLALVVSTHAAIGMVWALEDMATRATLAQCAVSERGKGATDRGRRRDVDVRIPACIIGAVAAKEMSASRDAMVSHLVRQVTIIAGGARSVQEQALADGDFLGVVGEAAFRAKGAGTCEPSVERMCVLPDAALELSTALTTLR